MPAPVRSVQSGDVKIAYQVSGSGLLDLVLVPGLVSHLQLDWRYPDAARLFDRLGAFARLIRFDRRGVGLSQRDVAPGSLEDQVADVLAVLDDAESESAALLGVGEGAPLAILVAAGRPERVSALVLFGGRVKGTRTEDYPWGETWEDRIERARLAEAEWGVDVRAEALAPGSDDDLRRWIVTRARAAATPGIARALILADGQVDVRDVLERLDAPTLVLQRAEDRVVGLDEARYVAERIRGARIVELPGDAHVLYADPIRVADEIEEFLTGVRPSARPDAKSRMADYRLESLAGKGGMGAVYLAHDDRLGRRVALKVIAPELAGDERFRERFLSEWRVAAALEHPNVVPVYDAGEEDGRLYLAMRYVDGTDLKALLAEREKLDPPQALAIAAQVAGALDAAHARGLVHRDVKPGNVLLDEGGHVYLCDFGLTKDLAAERGVTATGQLVGTLDYIAPEQIRAEPVDGRTDQYALACVLYECLAGRPPFQRESEAQMLWAHLQDEPAPVPDLPAVDPVLRRGLAKEPGERYGSCSELVSAAQEALGLAPAQIVARRRRRLGGRLALLGILLLLVAVAAAAYELFHDSGGLGAIAPDSVGVIDPRTNRLVGQIGVGGHPTKIAVGEGAVWALNADDRTVSRIDPRTRSVRTFATELAPTDLAAGAGGLWVPHGTKGAVTKLDPQTIAVERTIALSSGGLGPPTEANFVAVAPDAVWVSGGAAHFTKELAWRIDPATGAVTLRRLLPSGALALVIGGGSVWIRGSSGIVRLDERTGAPQGSVDLPANAYVTEDSGGIAFGYGSVWAPSSALGVVWRIDASAGRPLRTVDVDGSPQGVAVGDGAVWIADAANRRVLRYDPTQDRIAATIQIGGRPSGVAFGAGRVWVAVD